MSPKMLTRLVRESKKDPFKQASELKKGSKAKDLSYYNFYILFT